jgi:hypothetical protein
MQSAKVQYVQGVQKKCCAKIIPKKQGEKL